MYNSSTNKSFNNNSDILSYIGIQDRKESKHPTWKYSKILKYFNSNKIQRNILYYDYINRNFLIYWELIHRFFTNKKKYYIFLLFLD